MKHLLFILCAMVVLSVTSQAQLTNLTLSDPVMGNQSMSWYNKINKTIDSVNTLVNKIWATVKIDSLITSSENKTLKWQLVDSLKVAKVSTIEPTASVNHAGTEETYKTGSVEYIVMFNSTGTVANKIAIVGDSTNKVEPMNSIWEGSMARNYTTENLGYSDPIEGVRFITRCYTYASAYASDATMLDARGQNIAVTGSPTASFYYHPFHFWHNTNQPYVRFRVRIQFRMPVANTSTWYCRFKEGD